MTAPVIRAVGESDAPSICEIYNYYIRHTTITFEQEPVAAGDMAKRIRDVTAEHPWLIAAAGDEMIAYAYATRWRTRAAYDQTVESTIYVRHGATGAGIGFPLYIALLAELKKRFPPAKAVYVEKQPTLEEIFLAIIGKNGEN